MLVDGYLENIFSRLSLINLPLVVHFDSAYIYYPSRHAEELTYNCLKFNNFLLLREIMSEHLQKLDKLLHYSKRIGLTNFLDEYETYWNMHKGISAYDLVIHTIWEVLAAEFIKKYSLTTSEFFELTLPSTTVITDTNLQILDLLLNKDYDLIKKEFIWVPGIVQYFSMNIENITLIKNRIESIKMSNIRRVQTVLNNEKDNEKIQKILMFMELQQWVNQVDYLERRIDFYSELLNMHLVKRFCLKIKSYEDIKNLKPSELRKKKDLQGLLDKRKGDYTLKYENGKISEDY